MNILKEEELYIFEDRVLKLIKVKYHNRKEGSKLRPVLKLLSQEELNNLLMKGGLKE